jgi:hypothetical protein
MNDGGAKTLARRPGWWREKPDVSIGGPAAEREKHDVIQAVMASAERLIPGKTLSFELDYEPELLFRMLAQRGFDHWTEPIEDGRLRLDIAALPRRLWFPPSRTPRRAVASRHP